MDVVRLARQSDAEGSDHVGDGVHFAAQVRIGLGQLGRPGIRPFDEPFVVDGGEPAPVVHHAAGNHYRIDGSAVLAVHHLVARVVERHVVEVSQVQEHDVGGMVGLEPANAVEPQHAGAAQGRHVQNVEGAEPAAVVGGFRARGEGGQPHRLEHVELVGAARRVGADADRDARRRHALGAGEAVAEPQVAAGIVGRRRAAVGQPPDVIVVEPHRVGGAEPGTEDAEIVQVVRQGAAPAAHGGDRLDLGFRHVGMEEHVVFPGQIGHVDQEGVAAQERDGRCERRAHQFAVAWPVVHDGPGSRQRGVCRRGPNPLDAATQLLGHGVEQAGHRVPEHAIGERRRHHRAHSHFLVGRRHRADAFGRGDGQFQHHVVAGRAALADHLRRAEHRAKTQVLAGAAAGNPGAGVEQHLQGPVAGDALGQGVVAVGMGVDEPGQQQTIAGRYL